MRKIFSWLKQNTWPSCAATVALIVGTSMAVIFIIGETWRYFHGG